MPQLYCNILKHMYVDHTDVMASSNITCQSIHQQIQSFLHFCTFKLKHFCALTYPGKYRIFVNDKPTVFIIA